MKLMRKIALFSSCLLLFGNSVVPATVVFANENEVAVSSEYNSQSLSIDSPFEKLVEDGYLLLDEESQTVTITEKYKQEALESIDTNLYTVAFTDNSIEVRQKYSFRAFTGVSKIVYTWKGVDLYLDNVRANKLGAALAIGAGIAAVTAGGAALAGLVPVSAVAGIIGGLFAIGSGLVYYNNAAGRGIIIGCIGQLPNITPHWITSQ
ncbi:ABC transporter ATP-binding protein [Streptococcus suis]|nr:ABC transporter ATP-binding protein [Streptococcus suis]MCQ8266277.1 ABC transporter ATP-binding protein [Streptococcus suis]HEM6341490.1 ABC transporter ATP-binding protein [Streptococcus suis]